jgi:calcium-dependent protein kinase
MVDKNKLDQVHETKEIMKKIEDIIKFNSIKVIKLKDLNIIEQIGEGGQAKVYSGKYENCKVAVKIIAEFDLKCLSNEIVILSQLNHDNIPKFYGMVFEDKHVGLVIQCISGKSLDEYELKDISFETKVKIAKSLCSCLNYVHSLNYIHRDLKPENILIENKTLNLYLIDFGIAKVITDDKSAITRAKGTIHYLAPEVFNITNVTENQEIISVVTTKVDVWSFGCIVSYIFSGYLPWCNKFKDKPNVIQKVLMKKEKFPIPDNIKDDTIKKIVGMCVEVDVSKRASMEDIQKLLEK